MKAYVLHGIGSLMYEEVGMPACPQGWAIVRVRAAGICSSDIPRIFQKGTYHFPTIPGHEFAGEVSTVGSDADVALVGKRVGIFPLIPCRKCPQCAEKHYEMCSHYDYVGSRRDGGFAEFVAVPVWNLIPLPDNMPFSSAAMLEPLSVALHAIKRGKMTAGNRVAIVGTGMIGISAAQWAYRFGASKVTVIGRNESKRRLVEKCGIDYAVWDEAKDMEGCDFVLEAVGTSEAIAMSIEKAKPGGKVVLMGNPSADIRLEQDAYWRILRKQLTLTGTWNSSYDNTTPSDWTEAVKAISDGYVKVEGLISHSFNQEDLDKGLTLMCEHREPYCKVMTLWNR